jgi:type I restriction enzyme, S subunit
METRDKFFENFQFDLVVIDSSKVYDGDFRLTAEFFRDNTSAIYRKDIEFIPLSEFAHVLGFGPFKRHYIDSPEYGIPLISSSEMMEVNPSCEGYISKELHKNYTKYIVEKGWILVSCSGTIGNVTIVDDRLQGFAISQHALRVIPKEEKYKGYLYTYFSSEIGQSEVKGKKSGAVIDEIYEADLLQLPIPVIDGKIIDEINALIEKAFAYREQANNLLNEANSLVFEYNLLPPFNIANSNFYDVRKEIQSRVIFSSEISSDYRLDGHFYNPVFQLAESSVSKYAPEKKMLGDLCSRIFMGNRFTRTYVQEKFGIPFISTKNTLQIRPSEWKYLSKSESDNISELLLEEQWILLARSGSLGGTFGKVSFVWKNFEGFAGSEHIIRIVTEEGKVDPGYLYAFLTSQYGYNLIIKQRHGALIDEIAPEHLEEMIIPLPKENQQKTIGDKVRLAYEKRAEAIRLEDQAQDILKQFLTN